MRTDPFYQQYHKQRIVADGSLIGEVYFYNEKMEDRHAAIDYHARKKVVEHGEEQRCNV